MDNFWNQSLTRKTIRLILTGLLAASMFFIIILFLGNRLLDSYFSSSRFIYDSEIPYIEKLTAFIEEENIAATDTLRLSDWAYKNSINRFTISRKRILIYDTVYSDTLILGYAKSAFLHYNWQFFHTVPFSDGDAEVFIYANYDCNYYLFFWCIDLFLSITVLILIFAYQLRKEIAYIHQLTTNIQIIESGNFQSKIPIKGSDELTRLASGIAHMQAALIAKEQKENEMKAAQNSLVLGMAHDLRTPLTGLIAFLEIAQKQSSLESCISYLDKAYLKTTQIRNLSNQLFEYFLIHSKQLIKLEEPELLESVLGDYLSEFCALMSANHFMVSFKRLSWKTVQVSVCIEYLGRIMDNIVSNVLKYADASIPIEISSEYHNSYVCITFQNQIVQPNSYVDGTGIGIKNISSMMAQMNGNCNVNVCTNHYSISLEFPIADKN